MKKLLPAFLFGLTLISCGDENPLKPDNINTNEINPFNVNRKLGRGINLGNMLEAPVEGEWGYFLKTEYFKIIKDAEFNSVRVPIRWSAHAQKSFPYAIDEPFFQRIDRVIEDAFANNLMIIINIHHFEEVMSEPDAEKERFLSLWQQISKRYKNHSNDLLFEILNEPNKNLTPGLWNIFLNDAIRTIRTEDKERTILIGTANGGGVFSLKDLILPEDEKNLIVTFHYYSPFQFTHQGAEWVSGSDNWLGKKWTNRADEREAIIQDFNFAFAWAATNRRPINLGEFGAYSKADMNSRVLWTTLVSHLAIFNGFSFQYWEFCAGFGAYDIQAISWRQALLDALIPNMPIVAGI